VAPVPIGSGPATVGAASPAAATLDSELKIFEAELHNQQALLQYEKDRLAALDNISRLLLTFAGVFAVLLGVGSWKTLDDQRRSAKESLEIQIQQFKGQFEGALADHNRKLQDALDDVRSLREEIHKDFPMFGRIRRNFDKILHGLQFACQHLRPEDDTFGKLTWEERERIQFYEKTVADSLLLDVGDYADQLSEIYRLLGVFYGSRYATAVEQLYAQIQRRLHREYLDRARFYFDRAIDANPKSYLAYAHAGHFTMYLFDAEMADVSRQYLREAAACGRAKQRPLINLMLNCVITYLY
jgi:tetratricopeptide (TPR) repeat protein